MQHMLSVDEVYKTRQTKPMVKVAEPRMRESKFELLEVIHQFKAIRSNHIAMHLPHRHYRGLRHSLKTLTDQKLLGCHKEIYHHSVYWLTPKGKRFLNGRDLPPRFVPVGGGLGLPLNNEWHHSMMVCDLLSNLKAGADKHGIRMISAEEIAEQATVDKPFVFPRRSRYFDKKQKREVPYTIVPDGFFGLEYPNGKKAYFAIEAENNKAHSRFDDDDLSSTQSSTNKKFKAYCDIDMQGVYSNLGIGNMRVLVAAPTPTQIKNKFEAGRKVVDKSQLFLGHWLPIVAGKDVPVLPDIIDAAWLRIGMEPEHINGTALQTSPRSEHDHRREELRPQA